MWFGPNLVANILLFPRLIGSFSQYFSKQPWSAYIQLFTFKGSRLSVRVNRSHFSFSFLIHGTVIGVVLKNPWKTPFQNNTFQFASGLFKHGPGVHSEVVRFLGWRRTLYRFTISSKILGLDLGATRKLLDYLYWLSGNLHRNPSWRT